MKDLKQKMAAGEPLMQQAMEAMRLYEEAKGHASPEEVQRLGLHAVSLMQKVQEYQMAVLGGSARPLH